MQLNFANQLGNVSVIKGDKTCRYPANLLAALKHTRFIHLIKIWRTAR